MTNKATNTLLEQQRKALLKKFHTLLGKCGIDEDGKRELLRSYGVYSSRELDAHHLLDLCNRLHNLLQPGTAELDVWRKRVMAAIGAWLRALGKTDNAGYIKAIATQAAQKKHFNHITLSQLRSLYAAFKKKTNDLSMVEKLTQDELDLLTCMN